MRAALILRLLILLCFCFYCRLIDFCLIALLGHALYQIRSADMLQFMLSRATGEQGLLYYKILTFAFVNKIYITKHGADLNERFLPDYVFIQIQHRHSAPW